MAGPPVRAKAEGGGLQLALPRRRGGRGEGPLCASHCALRSGPGTAPAPSPPGPAGRAPPFGSPCRHFVDARGGWLLLRALPHVEPVAMLSSCLLSIPRSPCQACGAIRARRCYQGLRAPSRPEWLLGDRAAWPGLIRPVVMAIPGPVQPGVMAAPWGWGKSLLSAGELAGSGWKMAPSQQPRNGAATPLSGSPALPCATEALRVPKGMGFSPKLPSELQKAGVPTATARLGAWAAEDEEEPRSLGGVGGRDVGWVFRVSPDPEPKLWFLCHLTSLVTQELTKPAL